jgi:hypothetical protein
MTRRRFVGALVVLAACGVRRRPLPPELVQPAPPSQLVGASVPEGIRLTWRRPSSYTGGKPMRDLGHFDIERADGADGIVFTHAATVAVTDQLRFRQEKTFDWTDTTATVGSTYRYRVIAVTLDDYHSAPGGPVTIEHRPAPTPKAPKPGTR